jgi:peptide/nickel transport system substrate-binding protein
MFRRLLLSLTLAVMLGGPLTDAYAAGPTLHFRLGEDPETLYNVKSFSLTVSSVLGPYLLDRLVYFDASGQPKPWLAESWVVGDDQKQITFKLRSGITFTDGTDFNAAAAKAQFDAVMDKKNASPLLPLLGSLQTVEAPDATTLRFTFAKPFAPFLSNIAQASFGFNSPTAVAKYGSQYGRHVVGTGPYMLKSWDPGSEIVLVRNPDYHQYRGDAVNKGAPIAARIVLTVISEEGVAQAALEEHELTAAAVSADAIDALVKNPAFTTVINKVVTNLYFIEFNERRAPFNDPDMRRAIGYAIDRAAVVKAAFNSYASPALGPLASGIPGYDAGIGKKYGTPYDPAKAKALLAAAGWKPGADGVLVKDGKAARFVIKSYSGFVTIDRTLSVIQSNLADIGIKVSLQTSDWGTFYPSLLKNDWDMDLMRWTNSDPSVLSVLFRSPGHRKATLPDARTDAALDRCDTLMNPTTRAGCVGEAQIDLLKASTIVPVASNWSVIITQADVKDYTIDYFNNLIPGDVRIVN